MPSEIITKTGALWYKRKNPSMDQKISGEQNSKSCRRRSYVISISRIVRCSTRHNTWTILFLIYINDMPSTVSSTIGLFPDDTYIYRLIRNIEDCKILQYYLQKLIQWEQSWSMKFHPDKYEVLRNTNKRKVSNCC